MGKLKIEIALSIPKLEAWVAKTIGTKRAKLPDIEATTWALEEFIKANGLRGGASFTLSSSSDYPNEINCTIEGEGLDFQKTRQLIERDFSTS